MQHLATLTPCASPIVVPTLDEEDALRAPPARGPRGRRRGRGLGRRQRRRHPGGGPRSAAHGRRPARTRRAAQPRRRAAADGADRSSSCTPTRRCQPGALGRARRAVAAGAAGGAFLLRFDADRADAAAGRPCSINLRTRLTPPAARRPGAVRHAATTSTAWAASATGRSSRTSTSCWRLRRLPALHAHRGPRDDRRAPLPRAGGGAHGGDQLADLAAVRAGRLAVTAWRGSTGRSAEAQAQRRRSPVAGSLAGPTGARRTAPATYLRPRFLC